MWSNPSTSRTGPTCSSMACSPSVEKLPNLSTILASSKPTSVSRQALEQTDFAPLLMVYVQLSGDAAALDEYQGYITGPWNFHEAVPPELKRRLHERLIAVVSELETGKRRLSPPPSGELLRKMMSACVGQPVPDEYMDLLTHEMQLAGAEPLEVEWRRRPPAQVLEEFKVIIIGAGESGLCMGIK